MAYTSAVGIGNYIHYHYDNYLAHGTYLTGQSQGYEQACLNSRLALGKEVLRSNNLSVSGVDLSQIEQFYEDRIFNIKDSLSYIKMLQKASGGDAASKAVADYIKNYLTSLGSARFLNGDLTAGFTEAKYLWGKAKNSKGIQERTMWRFQQTLQKLLNESGDVDLSSVNSTVSGFSNLREQLESYNREIDNYIEQFNEKTSSPMTQSGQRIFYYPGGYTGKNPDSHPEFANLKDIIEKTCYIANNVLGKASSAELGALGEFGIAYAMLIGQNLTTQNVQNFLDNIFVKNTDGSYQSGVLTGLQKSSTDINLSADYVDVDYVSSFKTRSSYDYGDYSDDKLTIRASQDTVDIAMDLNGEMAKKFGTSLFTGSIKNYNDLSKGVSVIGSTSLLAILNLLGVSFANHYLNLIAKQYAGKYQTNPSFKKEYLDKMNKTLKVGIAYRALSGARDINFNKLSKYFIVIERSKKKVYVGTTQGILAYITNSEENIDRYIKTEKSLPTTNLFENKWVSYYPDITENIQARISSLIVQAQSYKISASLIHVNEAIAKSRELNYVF